MAYDKSDWCRDAWVAIGTVVSHRTSASAEFRAQALEVGPMPLRVTLAR